MIEIRLWKRWFLSIYNVPKASDLIGDLLAEEVNPSDEEEERGN